MRRLAFLCALLLALPAVAADTNKFPWTLVDSTCTDSFDTPAASTLAIADFDTYQSPAVQVSGSGDGFCDNDSRIVTGAIVADTAFGPFSGKNVQGFILFADGDTVTGGDTKYHVSLAVQKPHDSAAIELDAAALITGNGNVFFTIGTDIGTPSQDDEGLEVPIPDIFYVLLDLNTATSWTGNISMTTWKE